ncbi:hypothetical protein ERJ75_000775900 [Trypanosoma vivax]|nr:hypothetical protein ERJ75_000775900 [Trypanosoma vivax]
MVVTRVELRLRFTKMPGVEGERVFHDSLTMSDPHDCGFHDIGSVVERKLQFMEIPHCAFTVFHRDAKSGDMVVVDDAYLIGLLESIMASEAAGNNSASHHNGGVGEEEIVVPGMLSFDVQVGRARLVDHRSVNNANNVAPLTSEALQALAGDGPHVPIGALTCPPRIPQFFVRGVVIAVRFKNPKPGLSVCEIDLCEPEDTKQQITSVTFDAEVQKAVQECLRGDRKQVVELRNIYIRVKNDVDRRFQTNTHPLLIRMDRGSRIEVVRLLAVPLALRSEPVVTVRENLRPAGIVSLSDLAALGEVRQSPTASQNRTQSGTSSSTSSSLHSGARRTMLSLANTALKSAPPVAGVVPSQVGEMLKQQQKAFLSKRAHEEHLPWEPDTIHVTSRDVKLRDAIVKQHAMKEEDRKDRIRRRKEVSQVCIVCGVNCEDEKSLSMVTDLLKNNSHNMGRHIPSMADIRLMLSDRRLTKDGKSRNRLVCAQHFVSATTRTLHVVHCRCAHLCSSYQKGTDLEDVVALELPMQVCHLCGMPGASVACYHPDCREVYHTICALFSDGYVNFGKKDPYLPCPACPRHTQVIVSTSDAVPPIPTKSREPEWWEEDEVAFDSRVVEETDLRDPDENGGA